MWTRYVVEPEFLVLLGAVYALAVRLAADLVIRKIGRKKK